MGARQLTNKEKRIQTNKQENNQPNRDGRKNRSHQYITTKSFNIIGRNGKRSVTV